MNPLIWFHLYDYGTGLPYKGATVTSVSLPPSAVIDKFRDSVKVKCSNKLSSIDSDDLLVFKNKRSFDKRDFKEGREDPLDPTSPLKDLGGSKEPLVVGVDEGTLKQNLNVVLQTDPEIAASYDLYIKIGSQLTDTDIVQKLVDKMIFLDDYGRELTERKSTKPIPFMFLDGSSGMGKTQMAFTLMCRNELKVHYFVCSDLCDSGQTIYKRYKYVSAQFLECIESDVKTKMTSSDFHFNFASKACGFIVSLITEKTFFTPMTVAEGTQKIYSHLHENSKSCLRNIIFLDEFPHLYQKDIEYLRWMRNLFRNLHLVTICSSTSSSVANLIRASASSRDTDVPTDWCYVSPRFSKVLTMNSGTFSVFETYLFNHSRPLFSAILEESLRRGTSLDISVVLGSIGTRIHELKMDFGENFAHGQVCFLMAAYHIKCKNESPGVFSNAHFANLVENEDFVLQLKLGKLYKKNSNLNQKWVPSLSFPTPNDDILSFLCIMGNKGYYPICEPKTTTRIPFRSSFREMKELQNIQQISFKVRCENPHVLSNTGLELEAISTAILSLCSHYEGLSGIEFGKFLSHVLYELECLESSSYLISSQSELYTAFSQIIIPFLSAPSIPWPQELLNFGYNFCNLRRSVNSERIDFRTSTFPFGPKKHILSGECKDWSSEIECDDLEDILVRIPYNSVIHLVFLRKMRPGYYGKKSRGRTFKSFVKRNSKLRNKLILRFDHDSKELASIPGIPMNNLSKADGLILFICIDR